MNRFKGQIIFFMCLVFSTGLAEYASALVETVQFVPERDHNLCLSYNCDQNQASFKLARLGKTHNRRHRFVNTSFRGILMGRLTRKVTRHLTKTRFQSNLRNVAGRNRHLFQRRTLIGQNRRHRFIRR